jgi:hypothetical protein
MRYPGDLQGWSSGSFSGEKTSASPRRKGRRVHVPQIGGERFVDRAAALSALASVWNVSTMR